MLLLTALIISAIAETKNRTLEEIEALFCHGGDAVKEPEVSVTRNITHSNEEDEKPSQIFRVYI